MTLSAPPAACAVAPASGMAQHRAMLGGFTVLMLAAAWITFLHSETNA